MTVTQPGTVDGLHAQVRAAGVGALASFWYYRKTDVEATIAAKFGAGNRVPILADSGAFSAHTKGARIDIAEYADWLHRWKHLFSVYVNLDVIGDADKSWANQQYLESRGLHPLPVFHAGSPWSALERMCESHSYIGIGGIAIRRQRDYMPWAIRVHRFMQSRGVLAHGFGATAWDALRLPAWKSCDSTSWQAGQRYGSLLIFTPEKGLFQCRRPNLHTHERQLRRLGFTVPEVVAATRGDRELSSRIAVAAVAAAQRQVRAWHCPEFTLYLAGVL